MRRLHRCCQAQRTDLRVSIQAADVWGGSRLCYHWLSSQFGEWTIHISPDEGGQGPPSHVLRHDAHDCSGLLGAGYHYAKETQNIGVVQVAQHLGLAPEALAVPLHLARLQESHLLSLRYAVQHAQNQDRGSKSAGTCTFLKARLPHACCAHAAQHNGPTAYAAVSHTV